MIYTGVPSRVIMDITGYKSNEVNTIHNNYYKYFTHELFFLIIPINVSQYPLEIRVFL